MPLYFVSCVKICVYTRATFRKFYLSQLDLLLINQLLMIYKWH